MKNNQKPATVVLKRMPNENEELPKQAVTLLEVLKAKGGKLTLVELTQAAQGKLKTVQTVPAIFHHYRKMLSKRGFVRVSA
jgi:hypothetical protein